ncbi:S8 family serine peptidase [Acerihabitans sp. TG2]|uniref:S8 family serine peptidase n=1 Tax=Acerihabitans sp. TG2 TaxID=3096008 RepID=UPI002B22505E|nr:S8 family serine peptidase [Acerihabitans sp. TG2]MEA9392832.1 S8 family serine peptidase [Acerihabitans sp. TG2]
MNLKSHKKIDFYARRGVKYTYIVFQLRKSSNTYYFAEAQRIEHELKLTYETLGVKPLFDTTTTLEDSVTRESSHRHGLDRYFMVSFFNENVNAENYINEILLAIALTNTVELVYPASDPISLRGGNQDSLSFEPAYTKPTTGHDTTTLSLANYQPMQHYLWPAKHVSTGYKLGGIDGTAGLAYRGGRGENVTLITNELDAWFTDHINLPHKRSLVEGNTKIGGDNSATVGIMAGQSIGRGIVGITPAAMLGYASQGVQNLYHLYHRLKPGDIIQIGMQHLGVKMAYSDTPAYLPVEFESAWFDIISMLTDKGIHVIQSAGHGGVSLDHPALKGKFDRSQRDSGAIIVGALDPRTGLRLPFSNFGSRVDNASWGTSVVTTSYGQATLFNQPNAWYINNYSGTAAATAIVAGAVACLSSIAIAYNKSLSPQQLRLILTSNGTILKENNSALMGTQPDLGRAIYAMFSLPERLEA